MIKLHSKIRITDKDIIKVSRHNERVYLDQEISTLLLQSCNYLEQKIKENKIMYGVNTGFGDFANTIIGIKEIVKLQSNIIKSHSAGMGPFIEKEIVRAMIFLRICSLMRGYSGISYQVLELLVEMLNRDLIPCVPCQGSLGASGDLVPLAHMSLFLIGEGEVFYKGRIEKSIHVLNKEGMRPITLKPKEGLALINGTQYITSIGMLAVYDAVNLLKYSDILVALTGDVLNSSDGHLYPKLHQIRHHNGQIKSASNIKKILYQSQILESCKSAQTQVAYSIRCAPQVHGASRDTVEYCRKIFEDESNAVTDNPTIFVDTDMVVSGGNFHGQPVALAADFLSIAISELANISERRSARLVDNNLSKILPHFLIKNGGLNSGFMIPQYTAASIVSENKVLSHPASVDSITVSANQEDHVSMGAYAARKCRQIIENTQRVLAIELLCALQALDFRRPLKTSKPLEQIYDLIRQDVQFMEEDRCLYYDMQNIEELIKDGKIINIVENIVGKL